MTTVHRDATGSVAVAETPNFTQRLRALPTEPGVYLMRDASGEIIYVGKGGQPSKSRVVILRQSLGPASQR